MALVRRSSQHGSCSTAGRRAVNEDRAATLSLGGSRYVAVVADGMGGARAGDVASDAALKAFISSVRSANDSDERAMLRAAFVAADQAIREASTPERKGMGSTLVAAIAHGSGVWTGNIGDSRAVLITSDEVLPLSTEHSVVGQALRNGQITEVEALSHPERHVVLRAIGEGDARPDVRFHSLQQRGQAAGGALVLLGSDGLFNFIGDIEILELAEGVRTARELVERVVRRALENGSDDNVTAAAIVIDPRRRQRWPLAAALVVAALAGLAGGEYLKRNRFVERLATPLIGIPSRGWLRSNAKPVTRVRIPADKNPELRSGMNGPLCATRNDCFGFWKVVSTDRSSILVEIRMNDTAGRK